VGSLSGAFNIATAVMTDQAFDLHLFRHLERAKSVYSCLYNMKHGMVRFRMDKPDFSALNYFE